MTIATEVSNVMFDVLELVSFHAILMGGLKLDIIRNTLVFEF